MAIKMEGWPLVTIKFTGPSHHNEALAWLDQLSMLLTRKSAFVVIVETTDDSRFDQSSRKAQGLWFKAHRELLGDYCKGVARVLRCEDDFDRVAGPLMQQAMPFPLFASVEQEEITAWAHQQLVNNGL